MYKPTTSSKNNDDLSIGFDRDRKRGQGELTKKKNQEGKYHASIMLEDVFGIAEHQQKAAYG